VRYSRTSRQTPVWVTGQALAALSRKTLPLARVPRAVHHATAKAAAASTAAPSATAPPAATPQSLPPVGTVSAAPPNALAAAAEIPAAGLLFAAVMRH
jgi:hypothetical protein